MTKTKKKSTKPKAKPLTISIHGDGIDIDATLGDGEGFKGLLKGFQSAAKTVTTPPIVETSTAAPGGETPLNLYADAMLDLIASTPDPERLHEIDKLLELGKQAVQARIAQVSAARGSTPNGVTAASA